MTSTADHRLYVLHPDNWAIRVKPSFDREFCHAKFPGDEHYHLLMGGEVHLDNGEQKLCLDCALRLGHVTADRTYWQKERGGTVTPPE
ncbi:MAG: hypothetical protein WBC44_15295 [Planctomycetaceae bacterium]